MKDNLLHLWEIESGQIAILKKIIGGQEIRQRLTAMGLLPGQIVMVVRNGHPGPLVVKVKESKIVLGREMAQKIKVEKI